MTDHASKTAGVSQGIGGATVGARAGTEFARSDPRVFISYSRPDALEFATRLRADLERGGCETWMDTSDLPPGSLWDARIEQGIRASDVILAIVTPHSLREESVCRDEVLFAIQEAKTVVPVRVDAGSCLGLPLLLVRRNWIDFRADYDAALARLLGFLFGNESALEQPWMAHVAGFIPLDFGPETARYSERFTGRAWLAHELEEWLRHRRQRVFVIIGEPGVGKSAIAAWLALSRSADVAAVHFCSTRYIRTIDPAEFVASIVAQLSARIPGYREAVEARQPEVRRRYAADAFRELVVEPCLAIPAPSHPLVVVVDALDEAASRESENIVGVLTKQAGYLPEWFRIVATTQPVPAVLSSVRRLKCFEIVAESAENLADLALYTLDYLASGAFSHIAQPARETAASRIAERAEGNFLYARMVLEALLDGELTTDDLEALPPGISEYLVTAFKRLFPSTDDYVHTYSPILSCLAVAFAPVPFSVLQRAMETTATALNRRLLKLRAFMRVEGGGASAAYAVYHRSFAEWLVDRDAAGEFWCDAREGHAALVLALGVNTHASDFAVRNLPRHLQALERWDELAALLADLPLLIASGDLDAFEPLRLWTAVQTASAHTALETYAPVLKQLEDSKELVRVAGLLRSLGHPREAEPVFEHIVERRRESGDRKKLLNALNNHALVLRSLGELDRALRLHEEQECIARDLQDPWQLQAALNNQAIVLMRGSNLIRARELLEEAASICVSQGLRSSLESALFNQAVILNRRGDLDAAMRKYDEAECIAREVNAPTRLSNVLGGKAAIARMRGELVAALDLLIEKERIARGIGSNGILSSALAGQALVFLARDEVRSASELLDQAESLCREMPARAAGLLGIRASVLRRGGELEEAMLLFEKRETISRKLGSLRSVVSSLCGRASCLTERGDLSRASVLLDEAESICSEIDEPARTLEMLSSRAEIHRKRGELDDEMELLTEKERVARALGYQRELGMALEAQAEILEEQGRQAQAVGPVREALHIAERLGATDATSRRAALTERIDAAVRIAASDTNGH